MSEKILVLGFRADTGRIISSLEDAVKNVKVIGDWSKYETKHLLEKYGQPIPGTAFDVDTDENWAPDDANRPWPQYRSKDIRLFVCSTITKEDTDEYAEAKYDGEDFARKLMPETPKLILHFKNQFRGDCTMPDYEKLRKDFDSRTYHLARDVTCRENAIKSSNAMNYLVKGLIETNFDVSFEKYEEIIQIF